MINEKYITVLGSTGSIGTQALDVCLTHGVRVEALSASSSVALLADQVRQFKPEYCAIADKTREKELRSAISDCDTKIFVGSDGVLEMISHLKGDTVLNSIIGGAGLLPTYYAIEAGKNIALANKETLVSAGEIIMRRAREKGVSLLPVDSEHCAIFECLQCGRADEVTRLILTASGGPFFGKKREDLANVTPAQALAHPTWNMGKKISIDSATLMNKCFEMIEAAHLFNMPADKIDVCVHRQSVVHSMVEFADSAVIAQMAVPDMRMCIQYALSYPDRICGKTPKMDFSKAFSLTFDAPDYETFKPLSLAKYSLSRGGVIPAVLNGVNDAAVDLFLKEKISFLDIGDVAWDITHAWADVSDPTLDDIVKAGALASRMVYDRFGC